MRVLLVVMPASGHFHPVVPISLALKAAGHEVRCASTPAMRDSILHAGLEPVSIGPDFDAWFKLEVDRSGVSTQEEMERANLQQGRLMANDLLRVVDAWKPDLIVRPWLDHVGVVAARLRNIPCLVGGITIRPPAELVEQHNFTNFLPSFGISRNPVENGSFDDLWLNMYPPSFDLSLGNKPPLPHEHFMRPSLFDRSGGELLPEWVKGLGDRPLVYATLGTIYNGMTQVYRCIIDALGQLDVEGLVTIGRNNDPASYGPLPRNVRVERYVPQSLVLPYCRAVVTHGGFNTIMSALSHGIPTVSIPFGADQPVNALFSSELGLGRSYTTMVIEESFLKMPLAHPDDLKHQALAQMIDQVVNTLSYGEAARAMQEKILKLPDANTMVPLIERHVDMKRRKSA